MKAGQQWLIMNAPDNYLAMLEPLPDNVCLTFSPNEFVDGVQVFVKNTDQLTVAFEQLRPVLSDDTILWVIYPKKNSGIVTDLEMMSGWETSKPYGLRPVASAAINNVWTSLRFRPKHLVKHSAASKESILKENEYSAYIDVDSKQINLPPYVHQALIQDPAAMTIYQKLAWSHRKEYLVWILSAKKEQTKADRVAKMIEMLMAGKRNPTEK